MPNLGHSSRFACLFNGNHKAPGQHQGRRKNRLANRLLNRLSFSSQNVLVNQPHTAGDPAIDGNCLTGSNDHDIIEVNGVKRFLNFRAIHVNQDGAGRSLDDLNDVLFKALPRSQQQFVTDVKIGHSQA